MCPKILPKQYYSTALGTDRDIVQATLKDVEHSLRGI